MQHAVETVVELLCENGCKAVWGYIDALEAGESLPQTQALDDVQRQQVLHELRTVMAVYRETGCEIDAEENPRHHIAARS